MVTLKKIQLIPLANTLAIIYFCVGIIFSFVIVIISKVDPTITESFFKDFGNFTPTILLAYPFMYAIGGFVGGIIIGSIYNLSVKLTGGIKIELTQNTKQETSDKKKK